MIIQNVNLRALPEEIKTHFETVRSNFGNLDELVYNIQALEEFRNLFVEGQLYDINVDSDGKDAFVPLTFDQFVELFDEYKTGYTAGYTAKRQYFLTTPQQDKKFSVFSGVYRRAHDYDNIPFTTENALRVTYDNVMHNYGYKVGEFIACWNIILDNADMYEPLFVERKATSLKGSIPLNNLHSHVFANNGFVLFEHILSKYVSEGRGRKSDVAYYYWRMFQDDMKYIHRRPEAFKDWFFEQYQEDLGKLKTLAEVRNRQRDNNYAEAWAWHHSN
jgi:hypothetical protein